MLMVIFGAGASYDSFPSLPPGGHTHLDRPPLASELFSLRPEFNNVLRQYPDCQTVVPYLRRTPSVEEVLSRLENEAQEYPARRKQLVAVRYYLREMLWECENRWEKYTCGVSNYRTFIDQIAHWTSPEEQVCLVTFNYDRLLESAMHAVDVMIRTLPDYISDQKFKLIKLHGSVNWARPISRGLDGIDQIEGRAIGELIINRAGQIEVSKEFHIVEHHTVGKKGRRALLPAIAVPVQNKLEFECPKEHLEVLLESIPKITKIIIIGWRGVEGHFKKFLADRLTPSVPTKIVAEKAEKAVETARNLRTSGVEITDHPDGGGFTLFVVDSLGKEFIQH